MQSHEERADAPGVSFEHGTQVGVPLGHTKMPAFLSLVITTCFMIP